MKKDDPLFDLAALEEGQEPLQQAPLPRTGPTGEGPPPAATPTDSAPTGSAPAVEDAAGPEESDGATVEAPSPPQRQREGTAAPAPGGGEPVPRPGPRPALEPEPAPSLTGLTVAEAADRAARGLRNVVARHERRDREIIRDNALTFFNVILGSLILVLLVLAFLDRGKGHAQDAGFVGIVVVANVVLATFLEIRATRKLREIVALSAPQSTVIRDGEERSVPASDVVQGDLLRLHPGDQVVADGHIVHETAEIDESLLTGEAESVRKRRGDEVRSGSFCTAGSAYYTAETVGADSYVMRLTADARELVRRQTPLQLRFRRVLRLLLMATAVLGALLLIRASISDNKEFTEAIKDTTALISAVVPEGLLLGLTVAFSVGALRLSRRGAIVQDIAAVEAMNYVDVVCMDKTGTITANKLTLRDLHWVAGAEPMRPWLGAFAAATAAESGTAAALAEAVAESANGAQPRGGVPFNSERRWSALELELAGRRRVFVLGAPETVLPHSEGAEGLDEIYSRIAAGGLRGVIFAEAGVLPDPEAGLPPLKALALLTLADVLRPEVTTAFARMEELEVEPKIISGDNPETVLALIRQLGIKLKGGAISGAELDALPEDEFGRAVDEYSVFGRIAPAQKGRIITALKERKHFVAMVGDGANDVRALRIADVAVAMESGSQTARAVSGIVLIDDSFTAFVEATAESQNVLGNSTQLSKLFIIKSFYAYLLIVATQMLGLEFPFLPRQGSLTALFTLGIPSIFIAATTPPRQAGRDFTNSVLRFALPASLALAAAAISVHLLWGGFLNRPTDDSRTLVALTVGIMGLYFMVQVVGFEGVRRDASLSALRRPLITTIAGVVLLGLFILTIYTPWLQSFFRFGTVGASEWSVVIPAVLGAMVGQYVLSHYWRQIVAWIVKQPSVKDVDRGRAL